MSGAVEPRFAGLSALDYAALLLGSVEDYMAEDGRPIGESRARPSVRAGVSTQYRGCPWPGSRHEHARPMNVSALRLAMQDWASILGLIDLCRSHALARWPDRRPTLMHFWRLAAVPAFLPAYLMFRAEAPVADGHIPAFASACNKIVGGVTSLCASLMLDDAAGGGLPTTATITAEQLYLAAEQRGALVGRHEVCAAPPQLIKELLAALAHGAPDGDHRAARACLPDPGRFLDYAEAGSELILEMFMLAVKFGETAHHLVERLGAPVPAAGEEDHVERFFGNFPLARPVDPAQGAGLLRIIAPEARTEPRGLLADRPAVDVETLCRWYRRGPSASLTGDELSWALARLAVHLGHARAGLGVLERARAAIHAALGRAPPDERLQIGDLDRLFGPTPTRMFEALLAVQLRGDAERCTLLHDGDALQV